MHTCRWCGGEFERARPDANRQNYCSIKCRLLSKVSGRLDTMCWEWAGAKHRFGYGMLRINGAAVTAHRTSWTVFNGDIPDGMSVLHRCDNPCCCNPEHLFLGTHADNMADMTAKGRHGMVGQKHSDETRRKISANRQTPVVSEAGREAQRSATRKRWQDPVWRAKFSAMMSGDNNPTRKRRP
jgi:hypothetical protein